MRRSVTRGLAVSSILWRFTQDWAYEKQGAGFRLICPICKCPIEEGQNIQFDHIHAIGHGGPHEYKNLRPVHLECHKVKSARDVKLIAKVARIRGETKQGPKRKLPTRKFGT